MKYVLKKKRYLALAMAFDALGALSSALSRPFGRYGRVRGGRVPDKILVIRLDHIGDVLNASGLPKLLKENWPRTRVLFLTSSAGAELLKNDPFIDELIAFDAPWFDRKDRTRVGPRSGLSQLSRELKRRGIDVALGLRGDVRENILMRMSGIPRRIGFGVTGGGFLLTDELSYRRGIHPTRQLEAFLTALGLRAEAPAPRLCLDADERTAFKGRCEALGLHGDQKWVGLQIDAGSPAKEWKEEHLVEFIARFRSRFPGYRLALVGTHTVKGRRLQSNHTLNLVGQLTLRELCLSMELFSAFVGADSGPTHIASVLERPSVFLYSGTNRLDEWGPVSERAVVLRHAVDCSPCERTVCPVIGHPCMSGIRPEDVIAALEGMLR